MRYLLLSLRSPAVSLLIVGLVVLAAGCSGPRQTAGIDDDEAPSGTNVIEAWTPLAPDEAYRRIAAVLQDRGYTLSHSDATLRTLATEPHFVEGTLGQVNDIRITATVRTEPATVVVLRGTYAEGLEISKRGLNGLTARNAWKELHQLAAAVGDSLSYRR